MVINVCLWDGKAEFDPESETLIKVPEGMPVETGWTYRLRKFWPPTSAEATVKTVVKEVV